MRPASQTNGAQSSKRAPAIQTEPIQTKGPVKQTAPSQANGPSQTALMTRNLFIESYLDSNSKPQCSGATGNSSNG